MAINNLADIGKYELDLDQLNGVTGGVITDSQKATLNSVLKMAKGSGMSLENVMGMIPGYFDSLHNMYPNVTLEEIQDYVTETWETI